MFKVMKKLWPAAILFIAFAVVPKTSQAAVSNWEKSASVVPKHTTDFGSSPYQQSLRDLKATGANYVTLVIPYYQSNRFSADLQRGWNTPTDQSLIDGVNFAHSIGLNVNFKMHIELFTGEWRAFIDPNGAERSNWYTNYGNILKHYAGIGQSTGVEQFTLGTELIRMSADDHNSGNTQAWRNMISSVRAIYGGKLTYSANWGESFDNTEPPRIKFWDALDYIGISAYYWLNRDWNDNSVSSFASGWQMWDNTRIAALNQTWNKPILFSEVGYRSYTGSHTQPWEWNSGGEYNGQTQANAYEALFQYWNNRNYMVGVSFWDWETDPNAGGNGHIGFTPQNKPAEQVMTNWFSGGGGGTTPPPTGTPTLNTTASVSPSSPAVSSPVIINAGVTNTGNSTNNLIVDLEIYNSSNAKVFQKFYEGQNFSQNQTRNYSEQFTPNSSGTYKIFIGIFGPGWSPNHLWKEQANFSVGQTNPNPNPPPACTNVDTNAFAGCYYNNPDLTDLKITRSESNINFDWGTGSPDPSIDPETFSVQWQGNFNFDSATYDFTVTSDDGIRVWLGNELILDKWVDQPPTTYNIAKATTAGPKLVKVQYYENGGGAVAKVSWTKRTSSTPPPNPDPPPSSGQIEIWWPTNGTYVSGVQPFQSILQNAGLDSYAMFWQVDGDTLNPMFNDSSNGAPHKRAWVDVSGWTWNGTGPYRINFVAKNSNGQIIAQKGVLIHIAR